jgi:D-glycero-alpha-D-manno-heptose-7-phosphate kinase
MIISQTPLRISFAGGGTDLREFYSKSEGKVISSAIDKYIFVVVKKRFDDKIRVGYTRTEMVNSIDELQHELVREAMRKVGIYRGIEVTTMADIPSAGSGLGSSSTLTVGLLNALYAYKGAQKPPEVLAREAAEIEVDILKKPIGKQDHYIAAYGGMKTITFKPDETVEVKTVNILDEEKVRLNHSLLLFFTGITRNSSDILTEQKHNTKNNKDKFKVLEKMKALVDKMEEALLKGSYDEFGEILHQGWMYKRQLASKITNSNIDKLYEKALKAGALGGKIAGAGGGGFLLLYCPNGIQERIAQALKPLRQLRFHLERDGSKIIFNIRR